MITKGQIITVDIIDLNHMGQGVAKADDFVIFVDNGLMGDKALIEITEVKKNFGVGKIIKIIDKSDIRIAPPCKYFETCGGCQLMHMDYSEQLKYKKDRVVNELKRAKVKICDVKINDTLGMEDPFRYRNKTAFSVSKKNGETVIGPYEQRTYNTVSINECLLQSAEADKTVRYFKNLMLKYKLKPYDRKTGKGTVKNIILRNNRYGELMLIIVTVSNTLDNKEKLIKELTSGIKDIKSIVQNINNKKTNIIMGRKNIILYGDETIRDYIDDLSFTISPETFFQINPIQTERLYKTTIEYAKLGKDDICFDIYCGIGTISLLAAKKAKQVYGIEIVEQSIVNAGKNARLNNIRNAEFYAGKAEKILPNLYGQNIKGDVVILDPPRKGCERTVIDTIVDMAPKRVVYVSCNPATLARDIKLFEQGGYKLEEVQPVDMFPWTVHVEVCCCLTRVK